MPAAPATRKRPRLAALAALLALGSGLVATGVSGAQDARPHLDWRPHYSFANRYIKHRAGTISYGVVGPNGNYQGHRGGRTVPMASTFKVMLLATYLRKIRKRPLRHRDRRLLAPMIRRSDNVAATRVRDIVGRHAIERLARDAHMHHFHYNQVWGLSRTSASDQAHFMYRFDRYVPDRHVGYARHLLATIVPSQRWGIAKVPLHGWRLHFKGGWGIGNGSVDHQVAFLDRRGYRVAVAIMTTSDPSHGYGIHTLRGVARRLLWGLPRLGRH
ncbi:MAG TPA: serine hydrolase [Solirubrobacterales bacterium]|jgi:hypothetical protein